MGTTWGYSVTPSVSGVSAGTTRPYALAGKSFLGFGLVRPFVRDQKGDFATAEGVALVRACVGQVLGTVGSSQTTQGELPWRPEFGSLLTLLRHRANDPVTAQLARVYVADALARWEPRVRVKSVIITRERSPHAGVGGEDVLVVSVRYDFVVTGEVVVEDITQRVVVSESGTAPPIEDVIPES
jgi:hypothetical protein